MPYRTFHIKDLFFQAYGKNSQATIQKEDMVIRSENITGWRKDLILLYSKLRIFKTVMTCYSNPIDWLKGMQYLYKLRTSFLGKSEINKIVKIHDKYYSSLFAPAINDEKFQTFIKSELNRFKKIKYKTNQFNHVFLAVTKKCPLQCDHCYEWERLNQQDILNEEKLNVIIAKLQERGVSQIHLTGGEPMLKFNMILRLIKYANKQTDFWLNTSGFQLTNEKARKLKNSGLIGVFISLDHFSESHHDSFRNLKGSYRGAILAIKNAVKNRLVVTLSVCVRKEFVNEENLCCYMDLAKNLGVSFVQFLEPKAVGHYKNSNVSLRNEQIEILESFFENYNFNSQYKGHPLICYHDYYQRRIGCLNTGSRGFYIDSNGVVNPCPFCHKNAGSILDNKLDASIELLKEYDCPQNSESKF